MHKTLLKEADLEQLIKLTDCILDDIKEVHKDLYDKYEMKLYKDIYGCHFNNETLTYALKHFINEDGTYEGHWNLDQTNNVARQYDIQYNNFNEYDWNYVMNMIYSDYYGVINNDIRTYVQLAKRFLEDKDAPEGKAFRYYISNK